MNIKIKPHSILLIISIICILVGFSIYKSYFQQVQEGLETRIKREDGKLVKRRKKKPVQEGLFNPFDGINELINGFKRMINFFKTIGRLFEWIGKLFRYLFSFIRRIFDNFAEAFKYIPRVFLWLGSYLTGGLRFITNLNKCFGWYFLDVLGQTLYSPIKFLFWLFSLQYIDTMLWDYAESIDCVVKKYTGYHLIHYSDTIQGRCYSFCPDEFPRFPNLDWRFDPPTLNMDLNF